MQFMTIDSDCELRSVYNFNHVCTSDSREKKMFVASVQSKIDDQTFPPTIFSFTLMF